MVMKMNKKEFVEELSNQTGYNESQCIAITDVIEKYFIFRKKNREKVIQDLKEIVRLNEDDAENVYDIAIRIINDGIKNKLKHPFASKTEKNDI